MENKIIQCIDLERIIYNSKNRLELHKISSDIRALKKVGKLKHFRWQHNERIENMLNLKYREIEGLLKNNSADMNFKQIIENLKTGEKGIKND